MCINRDVIHNWSFLSVSMFITSIKILKLLLHTYTLYIHICVMQICERMNHNIATVNSLFKMYAMRMVVLLVLSFIVKTQEREICLICKCIRWSLIDCSERIFPRFQHYPVFKFESVSFYRSRGFRLDSVSCSHFRVTKNLDLRETGTFCNDTFKHFNSCVGRLEVKCDIGLNFTSENETDTDRLCRILQ